MKKKKVKRLKLNKRGKLLLILIAIFIVLLTLVLTLGRYVYNMYRNYILESQGFYFNSTVMSMSESKHSINNWDGVSSYQITIEVNNRKNDLVHTKTDITYDIEVECSSNIRCSVSKNSGIIYSDTEVDSYVITFTPIGNFENNQTAEVKTKAISNYPYVKELSTVYNISVNTSKFSYVIKDAPNEKFLTLELTNSLTYYKVNKSFGSYNVGDNVSIDDYNQLTAEEKANCYSAIVTISFDPKLILLDMTDNTYLQNKSSEKTEVLNDYNYVNGFSFPVDASSSLKIIFYKNDSTKDYSYDGTNDSIIKVDVVTVE